MKLRRNIGIILLVIAASIASTAASCGPNSERIPIYVGQSGLAAAKSVGSISGAAKALEQASILPTASALKLQETLLVINTQIARLPPLLEAIDAAQKAGSAPGSQVDQALAILESISPDIAVLLAGVPVNETTKTFIELVRVAQSTVTTVLIEVAKLKGREQ